MTVTLDGKTLNVKDISLHYNFVGVERDIWNSTKGLCRRIKTLGVVREWTLECFEENVPWTDSVARYLEEQAAAGAELDFNVDLGDLYTVNTRIQVLGCDLSFDTTGNVNVRRFTVKVRDKGYNPSGITDDSCVLYLPMDEGNGSVVYDKSERNNDGTVYGAVWADGKYGKALYFDGVDDYVEIADSPSLRFGAGDFTIAFWGFIDPATPNHGGFIAKGAASRAYGVDNEPTYCIRPTYGGRVAFYIENGVSLAYIHAYDLWDGEWHFYAGVRDGDTLRFYVDGVEVGTRNITGFGSTDNDHNLVIGRQVSTGGKILLGAIDEVHVYNRALSEGEIEWLYRSGLIRLGVKYLQPISIEQTLIQKASDIPTWENGAFTLQRELQGQIREWTIECIEEGVPWTRSSALYAAERTLLEGVVPLAVRSEVLALEETNVKLRNLEIHLEPLGNKNVRKYTLTLQET